MQVQKIKAVKVQIIIGKPDPNCPHCKGSGFTGNIHCACKMSFGEQKEEELFVASEKMPDGGVKLDFQEVKK